MTIEPLNKDIYNKAIALGIEKIVLNFSGGNDEGYLNVTLYPWHKDKSDAHNDLNAEVENWAWSVYSYGGAGDGGSVVVVVASVVVVGSTVVVGASVVVVGAVCPYDHTYSAPGSPLRHARQSAHVGHSPASAWAWGWVMAHRSSPFTQVNWRPPSAFTAEPMNVLRRVAAGIR